MTAEKKNFCILYVDDDKHNLTSFRATFRREYKVKTALSGVEGIEILRKNPVDLVITDQRMPEMTGVQFLEQILPEFPDIIRMVLTGYSDIEAILNAINSGQVYRYITKPWSEHELRMTIENARELRTLGQRNKELLSDLQRKVEEQERTLRLFTRYVPEAVVKKTLHGSDDSMFDGEQLHVSALFCDIRDYTPLSERLTPREIVTFLNDFYGMMTECVKCHQGTVNMFAGDEVFAVFGAPVATMQNEENAVLCALDMLEKRPLLNQKYAEQFGTEINFGIGIHSGEVVAGNLGSEARINYSCIGDTINTAKRIESITKSYPNSILVGDSTFQKVQHLIESEAFEPIHVKGKQDKLQVHQVLGRKLTA